jgi:serine/threonine protein kinase
LYELLENTSLSPDQQEIVTNLLKLLATHPADMREQKIKKIDLLLAIEPEKLVHISQIGKGAYGVVSKVKRLDQSVANYKSFKISSELKIQARSRDLVKHFTSHIVQVFGCSVDKRTSECSLVMELVHEDLNDHIDAFMKSPSGALLLQVPVALDIMLQIAEAVQYLH